MDWKLIKLLLYLFEIMDYCSKRNKYSTTYFNNNNKHLVLSNMFIFFFLIIFIEAPAPAQLPQTSVPRDIGYGFVILLLFIIIFNLFIIIYYLLFIVYYLLLLENKWIGDCLITTACMIVLIINLFSLL